MTLSAGASDHRCRLCGQADELNSDDVCFGCWAADDYEDREREAEARERLGEEDAYLYGI